MMNLIIPPPIYPNNHARRCYYLDEFATSRWSIQITSCLVLRQLPTYDDFLVCGISTQLHQEIIDFDVVLEAHADNGLRANSLIRLSFLAILSVSDRRATIGQMDSNTHRLLLSRLSNYLIR